MIAIALAAKPHQCTLVPERPEEVTTEGGLEIAAQAARLVAACERLRDGGIAVSLFVDPEAVPHLEPFSGIVEGFELNTDAYTRATGGFAGTERAKLAKAASIGAAMGYQVYAGHGLTATNVGPVASIREVEELNIGHALISRAVLLGLDGAVREMLAAMTSAR
jgi:pyridoxine 5-phosphate synthase